MITSVNKQESTPVKDDTQDFLEYALDHKFGEIHCKIDPDTGMKAIIAIHNTKLGPALGGCRFMEYPSTNMALYDAMRLARGMSYKSALANLPLGGGKSVIIKPAHQYDREAYFHKFGEFVNELNGKYITALDSGTELADMDIIAKHTPYVASLTAAQSNPAYATSRGVLRGIEAAVAFKLNKNELSGLHIAIQGLGHVGFLLAGYLHERGVKLTVADIDNTKAATIADKYGATIVSTAEIHKVPCDVFSPCALGAIINDKTINQLQTTIIAGAANNQLAHSYHGKIIHDKGILYAPDYVINAGGVIFACGKYYDTKDEEINNQIDNIKKSLTKIFDRSTKENIPSSAIADIMAQEILEE